jgi:hypothetical protein
MRQNDDIFLNDGIPMQNLQHIFRRFQNEAYEIKHYMQNDDDVKKDTKKMKKKRLVKKLEWSLMRMDENLMIIHELILYFQILWKEILLI